MKTLALATLALVLAACGGTAPQGNAAKCKSIGGEYNSASRSCTLQAE